METQNQVKTSIHKTKFFTVGMRHLLFVNADTEVR